MLDKDILKDVISDYKRDFTIFQWRNERFKWEAVHCYQPNHSCSFQNHSCSFQNVLTFG